MCRLPFLTPSVAREELSDDYRVGRFVAPSYESSFAARDRERVCCPFFVGCYIKRRCISWHNVRA